MTIVLLLPTAAGAFFIVACRMPLQLSVRDHRSKEEDTTVAASAITAVPEEQKMDK